MAANEKPVFATQHTLVGGRPVNPGERIDNRFTPEAVRQSLERGLASDSPAAGDRAGKADQERRADVQAQIDRRSEKRDFNPREDRR